MNNPYLVPFLISLAGLVWFITCQILLERERRRYSYPSMGPFWLHHVGWIGFAMATVAAIFVSLL
jgi:hypothetical protein